MIGLNDIVTRSEAQTADQLNRACIVDLVGLYGSRTAFTEAGRNVYKIERERNRFSREAEKCQL